jgi:hypothetical protein
MKNNDLLLWGGAALAAYFLFIKPKQTAVVPATSATPVTPLATTQPSTTSNLLTTINNVIKQIATPTTSVVSVQAPLTATGTTAIDTSLQTTATPVTATPTDSSLIYVNTDDSLYKMFQNNDYPGALTGFIEEEFCN